MPVRIRIVGCGLAGASVAYHLAKGVGSSSPDLDLGAADRMPVDLRGPEFERLEREGVDLEVWEQGVQAFAEASAQNAGMVRSLVLDSDERRRATESLRRLAALPRDDWPFPAFRRTGGLVLVSRPSEAHETAACHLRELGVEVEKLTGDEAAELAPALEGAKFHAAYFLPNDGLCDPWTLGQGLLAGARRGGVRVRLESTATRLVVEDGQVRALVDQGGREHPTDLVVVATAAWTEDLLPDASVRPMQRHLFQSAPHERSAPDHPWCWFDQEGLYLRPEAGGFLCSPCDEEERRPGLASGSTARPDSESLERLLAKLERHTPALSGLGFERGWSGLRSFRPDRRPRLGPDPERRGLVWATALGGSGVSTCLAVGKEVADSVFRVLQTLR